MSTEIKVTKSLLGAQHVSYHCPKCGDDLRSPLTEAGKPDTCPNCGARFIVPGAEHLRQIQEQKQAKERQEREAADQRHEEKQREREARLKERQEKAKCPRCGKPTSLLMDRDLATGMCVTCKREQDEAIQQERYEARVKAATVTDDDAFSTMGEVPVASTAAKPNYTPPALPKKAQPEISEASRRTLQTAAEHAAAGKSGDGGYSGSKYPFLSALVILYRIAAVLAFCIGIIAFVAAIKAESVEAVAFGAGAIGAGISAMLFAEVINLFLDMEKNQRESNRLLEQVAARLAPNAQPQKRPATGESPGPV